MISYENNGKGTQDVCLLSSIPSLWGAGKIWLLDIALPGTLENKAECNTLQISSEKHNYIYIFKYSKENNLILKVKAP